MSDQYISTAQRREKIIDLVCLRNTVSVNQLSQQFAVSTVTIRNDLRQLEKQGCLLRCYGGAMVNKQFAFDRPLSDRNRINLGIKNIIAKAAAQLVEDNDHIILDSGSTTALMLPYLKHKRNLVVMTNSLTIAYELSINTDIEVIVAGGSIRKNTYSISGPLVEPLLAMYHFDKLFLGVDGFELHAGITTPNFAEASVNRAMCLASKNIIAVTDSSKFHRRSFCTITKIESLQTVVTDTNISPEYLQALQALGIRVIQAD